MTEVENHARREHFTERSSATDKDALPDFARRTHYNFSEPDMFFAGMSRTRTAMIVLREQCWAVYLQHNTFVRGLSSLDITKTRSFSPHLWECNNLLPTAVVVQKLTNGQRRETKTKTAWWMDDLRALQDQRCRWMGLRTQRNIL